MFNRRYENGPDWEIGRPWGQTTEKLTHFSIADGSAAGNSAARTLAAIYAVLRQHFRRLRTNNVILHAYFTLYIQTQPSKGYVVKQTVSAACLP